MPTLFADRFLRRSDTRAIDLATGEVVSLRIRCAGSRDDQRAWAASCARLLNASRARVLIDFGVIGRDRLFEAYRAAVGKSAPAADDIQSLQPAVAQLGEWIEHGQSHSNVLQLIATGRFTREWTESVARAARLRGFVAVSVAMIQAHRDVPPLLKGRSVVLLQDGRGEGVGTSVSILTLLAARTRAVAVIVAAPHTTAGSPFLEVEFHSRDGIVHAAERRPCYGPIRRAPLIVDARATGQFEEGRRMLTAGRHTAAERSLRAAVAAFERRGDALHAADVSMVLGSLLRARGRASDADGQFSRARELFQELGAGQAAVSACTHAGLAQTDEGKFEEAERTLRAAFTAATALNDHTVIVPAGVALARNFYWQRRFVEGLQLLQTIAHGDCPRYWSLMAKLHLAAAHLDAACLSASRAREALPPDGPAEIEAIVRSIQARVQARLGDMDALHFHARAGLAAARAARLPLQALRLRLTLIEGLLDAGFRSRAKAIGRRAGAFGRIKLPPPLKERVDRMLRRLADTSPLEPPRTPGTVAHESPAVFLPDQTDGVAALFSVCQGPDNERDALRSVAEIVRKQVGAAAVGIFGTAEAGPLQHVAVGTVGPTIARRCMELGQAMPPERTAAGIESSAPVIHLGQIIGALACRWTLEGPRGPQEAVTFARIAAAASAPLLQILFERQRSALQGNASGSLELIGASAAIEEVRRSIARAANAPFNVLIEGESGAGKELVARAIHRAGCRRDKVLQALNCAALTEELVDSELFGHAKGAFTGAITERLGLFESADGGTVFLDEVGELSARAQAKLLRALQEGEIRRIGENFTRPIDARLIAATNRSLAAEAQAGRFRQDLLYRLDVIRISVPPLRQRVEDVPLLAVRFWNDAVERIGSKAVLGQAALAALARYDWPGNVRELQNVLASLAVSAPVRGVVPASAMPAAIAHAVKVDARETLEAARRRFEERFVRAALARAAGHRGQTASALGVSRQGLAKLLQRLQLP